MPGPYDIFIAAGQSNMMSGYSDPSIYYDSVVDRAPGDHLYQLKQDNTTISAATQAMDFRPSEAGKNTVSYAMYFCRDYYIPNKLAAGRDVLILPVAVGGTGFPGASGFNTSGTAYTNMRTAINAALAQNAGNVIKAMFWQHGEEDVADAGSGLGNYATMTLTDGYNKYMTDMCSDLHANVTGGFDQVPILVGGLIPDICWGPTADVSAYTSNYPSGIGLSADGADHHNSANIPMYVLQRNMPNVIRNCAFVDSLNPFKLYAQAASNPVLGTSYWYHYSQESHRQLSPRVWKAYQSLVNNKTIITASW